MTGRNVQKPDNGSAAGKSGAADFGSIRSGKLTYTVKWVKNGIYRYFYLTCPSCGAVSMFAVSHPRPEDILNPGDVPEAEMPENDHCFKASGYGDPVVCCKKCGDLFFNRYVLDPRIFPKPESAARKSLRECRPLILSGLGVLAFFTICYFILILDWNPAEPLTPEQVIFLDTCVRFVFTLLQMGLMVFIGIEIYSACEKNLGRLKSPSFFPEEPGYLELLVRMGVAVPQKFLEDIKRNDPARIAAVVPAVPNYTELPDGKRLYRKIFGRCSCCGAGLCSSGDFSLRLGRTIRVCPECREEYYDPDFREISREAAPRDFYRKARETNQDARAGMRIIYIYDLLFALGVGLYFLHFAGVFNSSERIRDSFPEFSLVMYMTVYIFLLLIAWELLRENFRIFRETAYPESRFSEWLKDSEKRFRNPVYAQKYDLGRKAFDSGACQGDSTQE